MSGRGRAGRLRDQLGDRDLAVLSSLRAFRLMSGEQLRRQHFPVGTTLTQARKTRAALQRLSELRLVVRLWRRVGGIRAGSAGHVYGLSGLGHAVLDVDSPHTRRHRGVADTKLAFQAHVLAVSELAVELHEYARTGVCGIEELRAEPGCWRAFAGIGGQRRVLKPDLFVRLGVGEFEHSAFVEVDHATESLPTIGRKLSVYLDYWRTGQEQQARGVFPLVWWLVPDARRRQAIAQTIQRAPHEARQLFTVALISQAARRLCQLPDQGGAQ